MRPVQLRLILRWAHIVEAALLAIYLYSPLRADPLWTDLARYVVFPLACLSGLWMWQQARFARWARRLRAPAAHA